jgi:5-hydroxyisourate hydrolase-like protein (transthyretin family)
MAVEIHLLDVQAGSPKQSLKIDTYQLKDFINGHDRALSTGC